MQLSEMTFTFDIQKKSKDILNLYCPNILGLRAYKDSQENNRTM